VRHLKPFPVATIASLMTLALLMVVLSGPAGARIAARSMHALPSLIPPALNFRPPAEMLAAIADRSFPPVTGGNLRFQRTDYSAGQGTTPTSVVVGDLNRDGVQDLVTADFAFGYGASVSVLLGNPDGAFGTPAFYATNYGPTSVAIGDFNGDGIPDIAVADRCANNPNCEKENRIIHFTPKRI